MEYEDPDAQENVRFAEANPIDSRKSLFEHEERNVDVTNNKIKKPILKHVDENINNAIELRVNKQKHSDFFFKLHDLKEKIVVYNEVFRSK